MIDARLDPRISSRTEVAPLLQTPITFAQHAGRP